MSQQHLRYFALYETETDRFIMENEEAPNTQEEWEEWDGSKFLMAWSKDNPMDKILTLRGPNADMLVQQVVHNLAVYNGDRPTEKRIYEGNEVMKDLISFCEKSTENLVIMPVWVKYQPNPINNENPGNHRDHDMNYIVGVDWSLSTPFLEWNLTWFNSVDVYDGIDPRMGLTQAVSTLMARHDT